MHALQYFAHFDTTKKLMEEHQKWVFKFNNALPPDIAIQKIIPVADKANARFDAVARTYEYHIHFKKDPFLINRSSYLYFELDVTKMNEAAATLFNYLDFSSFAKSNTQNFTNNCKIYKAEWKSEGDRLIFTIAADRFLRNMVRAIVGTLINVGKGKISVQEFQEIIEKKNRSAAGLSVPACGLYLTDVTYPKDYFNE